MRGILVSTVLLLTVVVGVCFGQEEDYRRQIHLDSHWELFKSIHRKTYPTDDEHILRRFIWESNVKYIERHNQEYNAGRHTYTVAMNQFGDLTSDEYRAKFIPSNVSPFAQHKWSRLEASFNIAADMPNPDDEIDWRTKGWVTRVKDQANCSAGWSFAAAGAVEAQYANFSRKPVVDLSEQQLIDCSRGFGTRGCAGGEITQAFDYVQRFGLESEGDYRYRADDEPGCSYDAGKVVTRCSQYIPVPPRSENRLHEDLARYGPIAATIDAAHDSFRFYHDGMYKEPFCSQTNLNHGVLVVGCGRTRDASYWIVKNSFGTGWGMGGYIYMEKDAGNMCGIASRASFCTI